MSEAIALPVPTTPTSPTSPNNATGAKKFEGEGLPFKAKLIGMEDLSVDRDEKVCLESMFKLKAVAKARGEHKQRIQLNLTMSAVKVTDDMTKTLIANHEIERISFVVLDPRDNRAFGYIYNTSDDRHQFWAIKTEKNAAITVLAMKDLFELAFDAWTTGEGAKGTEAKPIETTTTEVVPEPEKPAEIVNPPPVVQELVQAAPAAPAPAPLVDSLIGAWDDDPPLAAPIFSPPPQPKIDHLFALDDLTDLTPAPVPVPLPKAEDPWSDFINQPAPTLTVTNPTPAFPPVSPPSIFAPTPAPIASPLFPSVLAAPMSSLPMSPTSPIAPPTVTNPLLDLDLFGPAPTSRVTKDQFFPQQQKQTIGQLQGDRQA